MKKEDSAFKFLVLGMGDLFTKLYYNTSIVLISGDFYLLVDFPTPLRKVIYEASLKSKFPIDLDEINHAILTHVHSDHSNGLETYGFYKLFLQKRRPAVYTICEVKDVLWENRLKASMGYLTNKDFVKIKDMTLEDYCDVKVLEKDRINKIGPFEIEIRITKHFVPCFGLRVKCSGRTLGYSGDTCYDEEHIGFLDKADLILHEADGDGHTQYSNLLALPKHIKDKMMLMHIPDHFDVKSSKIPVIKQGKLYTV